MQVLAAIAVVVLARQCPQTPIIIVTPLRLIRVKTVGMSMLQSPGGVALFVMGELQPNIFLAVQPDHLPPIQIITAKGNHRHY